MIYTSVAVHCKPYFTYLKILFIPRFLCQGFLLKHSLSTPDFIGGGGGGGGGARLKETLVRGPD